MLHSHSTSGYYLYNAITTLYTGYTSTWDQCDSCTQQCLVCNTNYCSILRRINFFVSMQQLGNIEDACHAMFNLEYTFYIISRSNMEDVFNVGNFQLLACKVNWIIVNALCQTSVHVATSTIRKANVYVFSTVSNISCFSA